MSKRLQTELDASLRCLFYLRELLEDISCRTQFIKDKRLRKKSSQQVNRTIVSLNNLFEKMEQYPLCMSISPPTKEEYKKISHDMALPFRLSCPSGENRKPILFLSSVRNIFTDISFQASTTRPRHRGEDIRIACAMVKQDIWLLSNYFSTIFSYSSEYEQFIACQRLAPTRNKR